LKSLREKFFEKRIKPMKTPKADYRASEKEIKMSNFAGLTIRFRGQTNLDLHLSYEYGSGEYLDDLPDWKKLQAEFGLSQSQVKRGKRKIRKFLKEVSKVSVGEIWGIC